MRVLVDGLDTVIEGEVIGGELLDGVSVQYDLEAAFTVQCDDGACFLVPGWLDGLESATPPAQWVMQRWRALYSDRSAGGWNGEVLSLTPLCDLLYVEAALQSHMSHCATDSAGAVVGRSDSCRQDARKSNAHVRSP